MSYLRPIVERLQPYTPGEQPRIAGLIKVNTNENPYPPSPRVLAAVKTAVDSRLRLYPNPTAHALRVRLAQFHNCHPDQILVGNGSDEILALATRAFVEPSRGCAKRPRCTVQYFDPSYSLYPVLAACHGAHARAIPLRKNFQLPSVPELRKNTGWDFHAALTFITTPNAPTGTGYSTAHLRAICRAQKGIVLLDEAYVDFAEANAMELALELPNVLVARTFSKSYALCFQRVGYVVGSRPLVSGLHKIRDSYNVNGLGQIAAQATLDHLDYYRQRIRQIVRSRETLSQALASLGFTVYPSQTNFILVQPPLFSAQDWLGRLREKKILVRWFPSPGINQYLRISVGTNQEIETLIQIARQLIQSGPEVTR